MKKRYPHKNNILLVNITRLGDMLQATPTIAGLRAENPNARITVLVEQQFSEVCRFIPHVDDVVTIDLSMVVRSLAREKDGIVDAFEYIGAIVDDLRSRKFDYCLNMSSSAYTALLINMVGIERSGGWTADEEGFRKIESEWARLFATSVFHQNRQYNSLNLVDVFRCSADVEQHPTQLQIKVEDEALDFCRQFVKEAGFTNTGPLIALQAGASQQKRQWLPKNFIEPCRHLLTDLNARIVLTGSSKELEIIQPILDGLNDKNVVSAAGKTTIPQLTALLALSDILVTGDTGPMHISVATGTPVVAMFLASAYAFDTGPYGPDNIVLQPVIGCGPCNPNKLCSRPDCHDTMSPKLIADLVALRLRGPVTTLPSGMVNPSQVTVYRTVFDEFGFFNLEPLHPTPLDTHRRAREAYRSVWLSDLGGYTITPPKKSLLQEAMPEGTKEGIEALSACATEGKRLIDELVRSIRDTSVSPNRLGEINDALSQVDSHIEQLGFHYTELNPLSRMFIFGKENIQGTDALVLASQMVEVYEALKRRGEKFKQCY